MAKQHPYRHCISEISLNGKNLKYFDLTKLNDERYEKLPFSTRVLLESAVRNCDEFQICHKDIETLLNSTETQPNDAEIPFLPARTMFQDFTGIPAVVDFTAMRDAVSLLGGDPSRVNPRTPVELVLDNSVQVDYFRSADTLAKNRQVEFKRNKERYEFLKWASVAFENLRIVPPGCSVVHQIAMEYLARHVVEKNAWLSPDSLLSTDSHTTILNGLGVLGWTVGSIEAESLMLGQCVHMVAPCVVGYKVTGQLDDLATSTDIVLAVTKNLRDIGVGGKFVEFFGAGVGLLSIAERTTISNMCPEYGATVAFFPFDERTLDYLKQTIGMIPDHDKTHIQYIEHYYKANKMFRTYDKVDEDPIFSEVFELDLGTIIPSCSGPKRPSDRVPLKDLYREFPLCLTQKLNSKGFGLSKDKLSASKSLHYQGADYTLNHGSIVLASITSCTNTSNPSVMLGAGLLANNAALRGLTIQPYIKASLSPGSGVVTLYFKESGVTRYFEDLGFTVAAGDACSACTGSCDTLHREVASVLEGGELVTVGVLSGNRNFQDRTNSLTRANYLASPLLVIAYALAGRIDIDFQNEPLGLAQDGKPVFLKDIRPTRSEIQDMELRTVVPALFKDAHSKVMGGNEAWNELQPTDSVCFAWNPLCTYIKSPPFFKNIALDGHESSRRIVDAFVLLHLGDNVSTDHISPAGMIARNSPGAKYLSSLGLTPREFNSYGARRGNHDVMSRGTFANIRLVNKFTRKPGPKTVFWPDGGKEEMDIFDASVWYKDTGRTVIILAGKNYGCGPSRDWAAKGQFMLGVKAVIAESFDSVHRSNLVGVGILPLEYLPGQSAGSLRLTGQEQFTIVLPEQLTEVGSIVDVRLSDGRTFCVKMRLDSEVELLYYRNGGILDYMIRKFADES